VINYKLITRHLSEKQKSALRKGIKQILSLYPANPGLRVLAMKHGTDKLTHGYIPKYEQYFAPLRLKQLQILEIGIGGYDDPKAGGESLRMWKEYFPNSIIYGIDIYDKKPHEEKRIRIFQGRQDDPEFLKAVVREAASIDIVIDDGSHVNEHVISSFRTLFPLLVNNGIYAIEDLHTSYIPKYGGTTENLDDPATSLGVLKTFIDGLNYQWLAGREPTYFDHNILSVHFYPKMAFIFKGVNQKDPRSPACDHQKHSSWAPEA
jgi:hypothetical protein